MQDMRESVFPQINHLSRSVFCFFSSRKEIVPLLFFLEEKTVGMRGKRNPSDGRTQAHPALSSVGIPQRVCLPPPPCLCPCPPRLRATQNGCLLFFLEEKKQKKIISGTVVFLSFCHFPQRAAQNGRFTYEPSSFLFRRKEAKENRLRNSCLSVLLPFSPTRCTKRTVQMRTVRFYVLSRTCGKASFLR